MKEQNRRAFIARCGTLCAGLAIGAGLSACATVKVIPHQMGHSKISVKKSDFQGAAGIIRMEGLQAPIYLSKTDGKYEAVLMLCTHKQCELTSYGKVLHCPCHGSEFTLAGVVLQGPAEQSLTSFHVTEDENFIYIS